MSDQTCDQLLIFFSQITRHNDHMEHVEWVQFFSKRRQTYVLETKEFTILHEDVYRVLQAPGIVLAGGTRFHYQFEL